MLVPDIRWENYGNCIVAGPSGSGKTSLLDKILRNKDRLFKGGGEKKFILYYLSDQPIYQRWSQEGLIAYKAKGTPSVEDFLETIKFHAPDGALVFFDDLAGQLKEHSHFYRQLFLVYTHHLKLCTFLILHNIFTPGLRELSLNSHKYILTYNPRDSLGVSTLSKQSFPGKKNFLPAVYKRLGEKPYSYLCLNFHQNIPSILRGRLSFHHFLINHLFCILVTTNWFGEHSPFVMAFQEPSPCSPSPYKCLHLISDELFKSLIEKKDNSCSEKCGEGRGGDGGKTHIENNYFGGAGDNGDNPGGYFPPSNHSPDNGSEGMVIPPPSPPNPPDVPPSNPDTNISPPPETAPTQTPHSDIPRETDASQAPINGGHKPTGKERRQSGKILNGKKRGRDTPYKQIRRIKERGKVAPAPPPAPPPPPSADAAITPADEGASLPDGAAALPPPQPTPQQSPVISIPQASVAQPQPVPTPATVSPPTASSKPKLSSHPKYTKEVEEYLKIKDRQMREREAAYLSSSDDEADDVIMRPRSRSPSPQSLIPKPKFKMAAPKISIEGVDTKKPKSTDVKPKLKKIEPDGWRGWLNLYDGMQRPAHQAADSDMIDLTGDETKKVVIRRPKPERAHHPPADIEMVDVIPNPRAADIEMVDVGTKPKKVSVKKQKPVIRVRKDLHPEILEVVEVPAKSRKNNVKKEGDKKPSLKKEDKRIGVRKDLYPEKGGGVERSRNIHSKINVRTDIFKKTPNHDEEQSRNIHSKINVRTDIFKKTPNHDEEHSVETDEASKHNIQDDSVEWIDVDEIPIFPPPINYSVKREGNAARVKRPRAKLVAKRKGHDVKVKTMLGKRKSLLLGKKIPPKMVKLNVGEKRKDLNDESGEKKQKKKHQSFMKLWEISKME